MFRALIMLIGLLGFSACSSGTYVHLFFTGDAFDDARRIELTLTLGTQAAITRIEPATPITFPTDAVLEISKGEGALSIVAVLADAAGAELGRADATTTVERGKTTTVAIAFLGSAPVDMGTSGTLPVTLTPSMHDFGALLVGTAAAAKTFILLNTSGAALGPLSTGFSGADAASFATTEDTCSNATLGVDGACVIGVRGNAQRAGMLSAALFVARASTNDRASAALSAVAYDPGTLTISPSMVDFGRNVLSAPVMATQLTITNTGTDATSPLTPTIVGSDATSFMIDGTTCNTAVAASATCTINVRYLSTTLGARQASLLVSDGDGHEIVAPLQGTSFVNLTVTKAETGGATGTVTSIPTGIIDCGATCTVEITQPVTLRATPTPGYFYFGGWTGDCAGVGDCAITPDASRAVTASFHPANRVFTTTTLYTRAQVIALGTGATDEIKFDTGADFLCTQAAQAASLGGTEWRAWVSRTGRNAPQKFTGKRGWVRTDGLPFADEMSALLDAMSPKLFYPPFVLASGAAPTISMEPQRYAWTGTGQNGVANTNCGGWGTATGSATLGDSMGGSGLWSQNSPAYHNCATTAETYRLLCFENDYDVTVAAPAPPATHRKVFVTSTLVPGDVGLSTADSTCQAQALAASLPGTYKALLATATTSIQGRFTQRSEPVVRVDGVVVADTDTLFFADQDHRAAINVDAAGKYYPPPNTEYFVWTGALTAASAGNADTCTGWTNNASGNGRVGRPNSAARNSVWGYALRGCSLPSALYCLQE